MIRHDLLAALPDLIAAEIKAALPKLATCKGIAGRFDLAALKRLSLAAPAVLVSVLRLTPAPGFAGGLPTFKAHLCAFVVTKEAPALSRDTAAANICAAIARRAFQAAWGQEGVGAASGATITPLITSHTDGHAVSLWSVEWTQEVQLSGYAITAPQPISLYVDEHLFGEFVETHALSASGATTGSATGPASGAAYGAATGSGEAEA